MRNLRNHENHDFHSNFEVAFGLAKHSTSSTFSTFVYLFPKTHVHYFPIRPDEKSNEPTPFFAKVCLANRFYKGKSNQDFHERENGAVVI